MSEKVSLRSANGIFNLPESNFEVTEADVRILDRDDAAQNIFS